jgi:hypothetical protein
LKSRRFGVDSSVELPRFILDSSFPSRAIFVIRLKEPLFDEEDGGDDEEPRGRGEGERRDR